MGQIIAPDWRRQEARSVRRDVCAQAAERNVSLPANRQDPGSLQGEVAVRPPDLLDTKATEEHEARSVHVGELVSPEPVELEADRGMVTSIERKKLKARQFSDGETERPSRFFTEPVEKPAVGFGDDRQRRKPASWRIGKKADRGGVIPIGSVEKGNEDAGVQEDRSSLHGRARP